MSDSQAAQPTPAPAAPQGTPAPTGQPQLSPAAQARLQDLLNREEAVRAAEAAHKAREAEQQAATKRTKPPKSDPDVAGELETLRTAQAELDKRIREHEDRRVLEEARSQVRSTVTPEEYPLIAQMDAYDYVLTKIVNHARDTGETITEAAAAKLVEAEIEAFVEKAHPAVEARRKGRKPAPETPDGEQAPTLSRSMTSETPRRTVRVGYDPVRLNEEMMEYLR